MGIAALHPSYDTAGYGFVFSRRLTPEVCVVFDPLENRGRRESRVPSAPAVVRKKMHTGDHRCAGTPGLPCAMVLRLITRSPWRRIPLASIADELAIRRLPV